LQPRRSSGQSSLSPLGFDRTSLGLSSSSILNSGQEVLEVNRTEEIRSFITDQIVKSKDVVLTDDRHLIRDGLINSIDVMRLITFMTERFGATLEEYDYNLENFETLASIHALVEKRTVRTSNGLA
jgi:acyl carrier protein